MLLQLYGLKRSHLILFALNVLQILLWFSEKLPCNGQSTALMMMMSFVFIFHFLTDRSSSICPKLAVFAAVSLVVAFFTYQRNTFKRINLFKAEAVYLEKLRKCEGKTYQSYSMGE